MNTGPVHVTTRIIIGVELSPERPDVDLIPDDRGNRIRPDHLSIEYVNGKLWTCDVSGRRVRADGHPWLDNSSGRRSYMGFAPAPGSYRLRSRGLSDRAPDWVRELVETYSPDKQPITIVPSVRTLTR